MRESNETWNKVERAGNQNTSGTAATVTGAAQTAITSVGTLTGITLEGNITINGSRDIDIDDNDADSLTISEGSNNYLTFDTSKFEHLFWLLIHLWFIVYGYTYAYINYYHRYRHKYNKS